MLFPDICTTSGKWFRPPGELFRRRICDETLRRKPQCFQRARIMTFASSAVGRTGWPTGRARRESLREMGLNPNQFADDLQDSVQLLGRWHVYDSFSANLFTSTRIAVVGNGNTDGGSDTPIRKSGKPIVEQMKAGGSSGVGGAGQMQAGQPVDCGAMSQQGNFSYHGNVSSPQQLLHLVGCRDPKVRAESRTGPHRR